MCVGGRKGKKGRDRAIGEYENECCTTDALHARRHVHGLKSETFWIPLISTRSGAAWDGAKRRLPPMYDVGLESPNSAGLATISDESRYFTIAMSPN